MNFHILKSAHHPTTRWSGGTTTQLYIFPEGSDYQKRDFLFRISTARVEAEESTFTSLPGFKRKLMILEGELQIKHKGHYEKQIRPYEQDEFDGGWETSAKGKVTDFNLMMAPGAEGSLEAITLKSGEEKEIKGGDRFFIYMLKGSLQIANEKANAGDLVVAESVRCLALEASEMIITKVFLPRRHEGSKEQP